jgi:tyrosyl-tRNA synthetase
MHADDVDAFEQHARTLGLLNPADLPADVDRASLPVLHCALAQLEGPGLSVIDLAVEAGLYTSKSDVRRDIQSGSGGLRIGGEAVGDITDVLTRATLGDRRVLQIRRGKRNKRMIVFH